MEEPTRIHSNNGRKAIQHRKSSATFSGLPSNNPTVSMIITSWNIRGFNSKGKKMYLAKRIKKEKCQIMLLQETKTTREKMEEILKKFKPYYKSMTVDAKGSAGGIEIPWNTTKVMVDLWIGMRRILSRRFRMAGHKDWFLVSAVYGPHILIEREAFLT